MRASLEGCPMMVWGLLVSTIFGISSFGHERPTRIDGTVTAVKHCGIVDVWTGSRSDGCLQDWDRMREFTKMSAQIGAAERVREIRISGNLLVRIVNQPQESGGHEPSTGLKRYVSGKMRNMCKSKTLQNKEGAQHVQIVEMRKAYDSGKMINMCTFDDENCGDDPQAKNEGRKNTAEKMTKSTAELGTVQAVAHPKKTKEALLNCRQIRQRHTSAIAHP